jgi:CTP:molybdopterin cytidylyltransferase MocA
VLSGATPQPGSFSSDLFAELVKLRGDPSGGALIKKYRKKTAFVEWNNERSFMDIDVSEDYEKAFN